MEKKDPCQIRSPASHPGPGEPCQAQFLNLKAASFKFSSCSAGPKSRLRTWNGTVKFNGQGADYVTSLGHPYRACRTGAGGG